MSADKPDFYRSESSCGDFAYTDIEIDRTEEDRMGVSHAIGRKKRRIKDTFAARNLQPRKKNTDVIVEQRTSEDGFRLELSRIIHAKKRGIDEV